MSGVVGHGNQNSGIVEDFNRLCFYANFNANGTSGSVYNAGWQVGSGSENWTERDYGGLGADRYGLFNGTTGVFTAKRKGWFSFSRQMRLDSSSSDDHFTSYWQFNGSNNFGGVDSDSRGDAKDGGGGSLWTGGSAIVAMEPGDYVHMMLHHWFESASHYEVPSSGSFWSGHFLGGI